MKLKSLYVYKKFKEKLPRMKSKVKNDEDPETQRVLSLETKL
jgi:hypothetical protein